MKGFRFSCIYLVGILSASMALGLSDEDELLAFYGDEDLISIASGDEKPIRKAPAVASMIKYEDIKNMGYRDIDDVLETVPGLHVSRDVLGYNPIYTFRGIYTSLNPQVLVLINGIPVTNLLVGDRNQAWGGMPVEAVSRIEIMRGPGSSLYGADAFAGVINIILKSGGELKGIQSGIRAGSFDSSALWALYGFQRDDKEFSLALEYSETNGHDSIITSDAQSFLDRNLLTNASNAPGSVSLNKERLDLRAEYKQHGLTVRSGYQFRKGGNGVGVAQALDPSSLISSDRFNFDISYGIKNKIDKLDINITASYLQTSQEVEENIVLFPSGSTGQFLPPIGIFSDGVIGNPEVYEKHFRLGSDLTYLGFDKHVLKVGLGHYVGDIDKIKETKNFGLNPETGSLILPGSPLVDVTDTSLVFMREDDRKNHFIFFQDAWHFANDWELTGGVRYDHFSDFGDTVNPRLALVWSTAVNLTTKLLYGEAFRAPSFVETRAINNPAVIGNPDLQPEEIKSYELAFDYRPSYEFGMIFNLFYYDWTDIIRFVPDMNNSTRTAQNAGEQTGYGMEFEVNWSATDDLTISSNLSIQNSTDETLDVAASKSPEKQFYLRGDWELPKEWRVNMQANWVMDRNRMFGDARPQIDDYIVVDVSVHKVLTKSFEVGLTINNAFDEDAREPTLNSIPQPFIPNDLPLSGRTILGEIRYNF